MSDLPRPAPNFGGEAVPPITRQNKASPGGDTHETIGEILSGERQRAGRTLMDISLELKIAPHHLIAIENGAFESLPGRAYAIGFVRSYAAYLGLDTEILVARLRASMAESDVKLRGVLSAPSPRRIQLDATPVRNRDTTESESA